MPVVGAVKTTVPDCTETVAVSAKEGVNAAMKRSMPRQESRLRVDISILFLLYPEYNRILPKVTTLLILLRKRSNEEGFFSYKLLVVQDHVKLL